MQNQSFTQYQVESTTTTTGTATDNCSYGQTDSNQSNGLTDLLDPEDPEDQEGEWFDSFMKEEKTLHNRQNKIKSLNLGALSELEMSLYLIRKGFTTVLSIEQKKSKQLLQRFRTIRLFDKQGTEIFNNKQLYDIITTEDGRKELKTDENGYPIRITQQSSTQKRERRSARNDVVILHVVYNIMLHNEINAEKNLMRVATKVSSEKVSKFRLKKIPLVNDHGITEKYTSSSNYRQSQSATMHDILSECFETTTTRGKRSYPTKYVCIGNNCQHFLSSLNFTLKKSCLCISREDFLNMMKEREVCINVCEQKNVMNPIEQMNQTTVPTQQIAQIPTIQPVQEIQQMNPTIPCYYQSQFETTITSGSRQEDNNDQFIQVMQNQNEIPTQMNIINNQTIDNEMNDHGNLNQSMNISYANNYNGQMTMNYFPQPNEQNHMQCVIQNYPSQIGIMIHNDQMQMPVYFPLNNGYYYVPVIYTENETVTADVQLTNWCSNGQGAYNQNIMP